MSVDVLGVELGVELLRNPLVAVFLLRENVLEGRVLEFRVRLSLFPEALGRDDLGVWVSILPGGEVEVVFHVERGEVFDSPAQGVDGLPDVRG